MNFKLTHDKQLIHRQAAANRKMQSGERTLQQGKSSGKNSPRKPGSPTKDYFETKVCYPTNKLQYRKDKSLEAKMNPAFDRAQQEYK
jgi:hypothetical protein